MPATSDISTSCAACSLAARRSRRCRRTTRTLPTWYRTCRRNGDTVRKLVDCLIAAVAIRADVELLHADADFEALARHTPLRLAIREPTHVREADRFALCPPNSTPVA